MGHELIGTVTLMAPAGYPRLSEAVRGHVIAKYIVEATDCLADPGPISTDRFESIGQYICDNGNEQDRALWQKACDTVDLEIPEDGDSEDFLEANQAYHLFRVLLGL